MDLEGQSSAAAKVCLIKRVCHRCIGGGDRKSPGGIGALGKRVIRYNWRVFESRKSKDRDLNVPAEVDADSKAREVLRAWVANESLICALRPETWEDASSWGIVLADVTRHVANAVRELKGDDPAVTTEKIRALYNAELANSTDEPTGHF